MINFRLSGHKVNKIDSKLCYRFYCYSYEEFKAMELELHHMGCQTIYNINSKLKNAENFTFKIEGKIIHYLYPDFYNESGFIELSFFRYKIDDNVRIKYSGIKTKIYGLDIIDQSYYLKCDNCKTPYLDNMIESPFQFGIRNTPIKNKSIFKRIFKNGI